jgi:disulfide bond formation protein DsbB
MKHLELLETRRNIYLVLLLSILPLFTAYTGELLFELHPCKLCLYERIPYWGAFGCGLTACIVKTQGNKKFCWLILALFLVSSFSLALFHVCVENRLLTFNSTCVLDYNYLTSYDEYIKAIISADLVSCDQPVPFLFGLSMAFWNLIYSIFCISIYIFITLKPKK